MYVCVCHGITEAAIRDAAEQGVQDFETLQAFTGCSSSCGQCEDMARATLDQHRAPVLPVIQLHSSAAAR